MWSGLTMGSERDSKNSDIRKLSVQSHLGDNDNQLSSAHSYLSGIYDTKYHRSLRNYLTRESLPNEAHYRNLESIVAGHPRPALADLHNEEGKIERKVNEEVSELDNANKLGWPEGVLMRCLLTIWGVMLFLRLTWVVGQAGIIQALILITLANAVTLITALSMSAVATNGRIRGGGVYFMISRSLGPEIGASIGLMFSTANAIAVSTYIIGFCDSLKDMLWNYFEIMIVDGATNDTRIIGTITLICVLVISVVGMEWVTKVQVILLFVLIGAQIDFLIGVFMGPLSVEEEAKGFIGLNGQLFAENFVAGYRKSEGTHQQFFTVFAVFFPAVTGIVAGANVSGDLKDASEAIPKGTLLAILITFITYIIYPILAASAVVRDSSGNMTIFNTSTSDIYNPAFTNESCNKYGEDTSIDHRSPCKYGLQNDYQVMELISAWGPLVYIGCFAATLSSAISSMEGAPRILQALSKDKLYPGIYFFSKGMGENNNPVRGYILVSLISFALIMIGNLNAVSSILSNFFLAAYCLINLTCFHASLVKPLGWRPSFKYYNGWVSLIGGLLCIAVMFLIDWVAALVTFVVIIGLYMFVSYRKPDVNWGSSRQGQSYKTALESIFELSTVEEHVKNYRPQILALSGSPSSRPSLIDFANSITKHLSLLVCGHVLRDKDLLTKQANARLEKNKIKAFYMIVESENLESAANNLFQLVGLGKLRPNILLIGYKSNWAECERKELLNYFSVIHKAFDMHLAVAILRVAKGLDFSNIIDFEEDADGKLQDGYTSDLSFPPSPVLLSGKGPKPDKNAMLYRNAEGRELSKDILDQITLFRQKKKGTIDVWWLYDDGGLTLLIPYILSKRSVWRDCQLRVFTMANRKSELSHEQRRMANLLAKFRIECNVLQVIPDLAKQASADMKSQFEHLIKDFRENETNPVNDECTISGTEMMTQREKTNRQLRLRECLLQYSKEASLIVMTLPMPRKGTVSAPLYMAWLEILTRDMPPFLLLRGNQNSVLTFYS